MKQDLFFEQVWDLTREIPKGRVTSYGAIAKAIGTPNLSRMVARAIGACGQAQLPVPYYRVISSNGLLSGDPSSTAKRQELLEYEGVEIKNLKVQNLKKVFWDPLIDLE
ncbi:MGMT family protein [Pedobacter sp. D749]|uniref:MGMT family protein n=1 Tax=Pedobacter sp. D749 TaxID=2856523 RepID=UPI001C58D31B|nr:MGMT family protein [Pedobacter sp. D749]QXU44018.1 MGMT family protein [Pedobacter sp. D749]